jgi:hypothetical protein
VLVETEVPQVLLVAVLPEAAVAAVLVIREQPARLAQAAGVLVADLPEALPVVTVQ